MTMDDKVVAEVREGEHSPSLEANEEVSEKKGTTKDQRDMYRMGKVQELRRNFRFISIFGFTMVLMSTWEGQLTANIFGLVNGGTAGLIWMYLITFSGFFCSIISMAEMASMAPTTGGQYHWVSEFAPASSQKYLSYIVGWLCVLGWQVANTAIAFIVAQIIQGLIILNNMETYVPERWHLTLLVIAVISFCQIFNTFFARKLPLVEGIVLVLHIFGFFAILIPLWVMGERGDPKVVFTQFSDGGLWGSQGLSCLIGMLTPIFSFIGPDSGTHMAEELRDASRVLPRAMVWTAIVNGAMGFVMLCTYCMVLGNVEEVLASPTMQPFIAVFYNATGSYAGTNVMTAIMAIMATCANISSIATSSRQLWAFARDDGLPFSQWLAYVPPNWDIPLNSIIFSYVFACLLSLINIGSTAAFNIVSSLVTSALLCSYIVSISCVIIRRLRHERLPPSRFNLGKAALPLNITAVLFLFLVFVITFFPMTKEVDEVSMNWSALVFGAIVIFANIYYFVWGRFRYEGPVVNVRKDQ